MHLSRKPLSLSLLLVALLATARPGSAQDILTGSVVDPDGGALPRAYVRFVSAEGAELTGGFTDARGLFRLDGDACQGCRVEASLAGFVTTSVEASSSPVRLVLALGPIREAVVVSATRGETPASQVGSAVTVIDADTIERRGTPLVADLLRSTPGVVAVRTGGQGSLTSLFVRGGESSYNKVLLDGIPLNEPGGTFDFSNVTTEALDRVELLRGAHSALFGTDAMASVVQLVTRRPAQPTFIASVEAGSYSTQRAAATGGTRHGRLDVLGHVSRRHTDNREPNNEHRNTTLAANGGVRLSDAASLRFIGRGEIGRTGSPGATAFGRPDLDAFYARRLGVAGVTLQHDAGVWQQRATYALSASHAASTNLVEDPPYTPAFEGRTAPFEFSDFTFDSVTDLRRHHATYQLDRRLSAGAREHLFTGALDWDGERAKLRDRLASTLVPASRNNVGAALQYQLLGRQYAVTSGLRLEHNDSFGTAVVPRAAVAYVVREASGDVGSSRIKASAGAGVKEPTITQSFSPSPFFLGNPDLEPERARTFDAGFEQRLFRDRARIELTVFHGRFENIISTRTLSFSPFRAQYFNVGLTRASGTELAIELAPAPDFTVSGGYTLLDSEITRSTAPANPVFAEGNSLFRRPRHSGYVDATWLRGPLSLTVHGTFVGERADSDFSSLEPALVSNDGYATWDLGGSYRVARRIVAFVHAENLADAEYMEPLGYPAWRRSARAGVRVGF